MTAPARPWNVPRPAPSPILGVMLDPDSVDLDELCAALDDRTAGATWWIDPATGRIRSHLADVGGPGTDELAGAGWRRIRRTESYESYRDMAEFVAAVHHRRAADLLDRAISGRGAFRRFKDTLFEFPELRDQWFRFRNARSRRRAVHWLADEGLVDRADADRVAARHPDPEQPEEDVPTDGGRRPGHALRRPAAAGAAVRLLGGGRGSRRVRPATARGADRPALAVGRAAPDGRGAVAAQRTLRAGASPRSR